MDLQESERAGWIDLDLIQISRNQANLILMLHHIITGWSKPSKTLLYQHTGPFTTWEHFWLVRVNSSLEKKHPLLINYLMKLFEVFIFLTKLSKVKRKLKQKILYIKYERNFTKIWTYLYPGNITHQMNIELLKI